MKQFTIQPGEAGQAVLKYLSRLLPGATMGLLRKSMRKKNITVNQKKIEGREKLKTGDVVTVWFSEETLLHFMGQQEDKMPVGKWNDFAKYIVYEDENLLVLNKPAGLLSQGDGSGTASLNDGLLSYLHNQVTSTVKPSICNRLDRNTSGLVLAGKTILGLQELNRLIKDHRLRKKYKALVYGVLQGDGILKGYLVKNHETNQVTFSKVPKKGAVPIESRYRVIAHLSIQGILATLVSVTLVTGRSHQIRIHFSSLGHPLLGDRKYGNPESVSASEKLHIGRQMLHAFQITFPSDLESLKNLEGKTFQAPLPKDFSRLLRDIK